MPASAYEKPGQQRFDFQGMCTICAPDAQPPNKFPLAINVHAYLDDAITPRLPQSTPLVTLVPSAAVHSLRRMNDNTASIISTAFGPDGAGTGADVAVAGGTAWATPGNITGEDGSYASVTLTATGTPTSQGPQSPTIAGGLTWVNPTNVFALDNLFASVAIPANTSALPLIIGGFGFTLPANSVITGIRVGVMVKGSTATAISDLHVYLTKNTGDGIRQLIGTDHANGNLWGTGEAYQLYGSINDTWGAGLKAADVNDSLFGISFQPRNHNGSLTQTAFVDYAFITINYTLVPVVVSDLLEGTNFGFALGGSYQIAGIKVEVKGFQFGGASGGNFQVQLLQAGIPVGTPKTLSYIPAANGFFTVSNQADLWGTAWVPADVNNANFGLAIQTNTGGTTGFGTGTWKIDYVRITVYAFLGSPVTGYVLISGAADKLYVNSTQVDSGYSQNRLAMVPFRPNNSVRPWMYVGDSLKMSKVASDGTLYKQGIKEPQIVPTLATAGAGPLTGTEFYAYSYRSSVTGAQSNLSPISPVAGANSIVAAANNVSVTCTASADAQVDLIDVWRFGVGLLSYTLIGTIPNGSPVFVDSLADTVVANNQIATFDNFEPFPSIDVPKLGTLVVSNGPYAGTKTCTYSAGDLFNIRWLPGTIVTLGTGAGATEVTLFARPTSTTVFVGIIQPPGAALANGTYSFSIPAPNLAAQPLAALWGPTDGAAYMFACQDPLRPGTLYFTKGNNPDSAPQTNQIELTSPSEPLIGGAIVGGLSIVGSTERFWLIYPNFAQATATVVGVAGSPFNPVESISERGLWTKEGICTDGGGMLYFIAKDGIRESAAGSGSQSITDDIDNLFPHEGLTQKPYTIAGFTVSPPDYTQPNGMALRFSQGYVYFDYFGLDTRYHTLKYHVRRKAWSVELYAASASIHADNEGQGTAGSTPLPAIGPLTGCVDSTIRNLSSTATEAGSVMTILTPSVGGVTRPVKHFGDIYIETSLPPATTPQFSIVLWTARYATQQTGAIAPATIPIPLNYRAGTIVEINGGNGVFAQDVGLAITGPVIGPALSNDGTTQVYAALYLWEPTLIEQPEDTGLRVTDWDDAGYPGAKFVQGVLVEADTAGIPKLFKVQSGDDQSLNSLAEMLGGVVFTNQSRIALSLAQPFIAHNMRLIPGDTVPWRLFSLQWVYVPMPELCLEWHTESTGHGIEGWQFLKELNVEHISTADLTLTLIADTGATVTVTIPNSGGKQAKTLVGVPSQWTNGLNPAAPKFKLVGYNFTSTAPFRLWREDLEVKVGQWGRGDNYQVLKPFGGQSSSQEAQV